MIIVFTLNIGTPQLLTIHLLKIDVSKNYSITNCVVPDQMPHSAASDLGLHCLLRPSVPVLMAIVFCVCLWRTCTMINIAIEMNKLVWLTPQANVTLCTLMISIYTALNVTDQLALVWLKIHINMLIWTTNMDTSAHLFPVYGNWEGKCITVWFP